MRGPFTSIRVLDLTRVLAGPFATMIMRDLGAEILKIELPGVGDDSRSFGPFKNGQSLYHLTLNRGKKSMCLDLKKKKGRQLLERLVAQSDVIVENFSPGTMENLGLGYTALRSINRRIIYASISGFGHTGPDSKRPAYDILVQALGGVMGITGWPDKPPTRVGLSHGDITAALYAVIGISSALYERERSGEGQKIDISMLDCQVAVLENALSRFQVEGKSPEPLGNRHPNISPFQAFEARDGWFVIGVGNDSIWERFCHAVERADLFANPLFRTNEDRTKNIVQLSDILSRIFKMKSVSTWCKKLEEAKIPCGPVNQISDVMNNRQLKARRMFLDIEDSIAGSVVVPGNPIKMSGSSDEGDRKTSAALGEHTAEILREYLGMTKKEIKELIAMKVISK